MVVMTIYQALVLGVRSLETAEGMGVLVATEAHTQVEAEVLEDTADLAAQGTRHPHRYWAVLAIADLAEAEEVAAVAAVPRLLEAVAVWAFSDKVLTVLVGLGILVHPTTVIPEKVVLGELME